MSAKAHCVEMGFEVIPAVYHGSRVFILQPDCKPIISESLVEHEVFTNTDKGDDMIVFVDCDIKVGNGRGRQHPHGHTLDLAID
jgi:hypothetical protein